MKNILITGCCGKLGNTLINKLKKEYNVIGLDNTITIDEDDKYYCDLKHFSQIYRFCENVDCIIHTAGMHAIDIDSRSRLDFYENNVTSTMNVLEAAYVNNVKKVIFISTTSVYNSSETDKCCLNDETSKVTAHDIYDETKLICENLCSYYSEKLNLNVITLRCGRFYCSPTQKKAKVKMAFCGVHIDDVVDYISSVVDTNIPSGIYNIVKDNDFTIDELNNNSNNLKKILEVKDKESFDYIEKNDLSFPHLSKLSDNKKAKSCGFNPKHKTIDILKER